MPPSNQESLIPGDYGAVLTSIKEAIRTSRVRAHLAVNRELVLLYWRIGRQILASQEAQGWGAKVVEQLSNDLRREFPEMTGLSPRNLLFMRGMAEAWPDEEIVKQLVSQIPWGHVVRLVQAVKEPQQREWYAQKTIEHGWSRSVLEHQIDSGLYERQAKAAKVTNFALTLPKPDSDLARELVKDPYNLEFLGLTEEAEERELHERLLVHLQKFLLELGAGFAFVGSHYRLNVGGDDFYPDLLFYHYRLKRFVVIELKARALDPRDVGQLNFYIAAIDGELRQTGDQETIGLLLCKTKNQVVAEYTVKGSRQPLGISTYQTGKALPKEFQDAIPSPEQLEQELKNLPLDPSEEPETA